MRLKNKPWVPDLIAAHPELITQPQPNLALHWAEKFPQPQQPLQLEIGAGKGQFIINMAKKFPKINFIALEVQSAALGMLLKKQVEAQLPNLQLFLSNANTVDEFFGAQEIQTIYLNFSDPWPKHKHAKRRLTHPNFLAQYQQILKPEGLLRFKTDNQGLFEYSLMSFNQSHWQFNDVSLDLHHSAQAAKNVETEYEHKFAARGQRIYALDAYYPVHR